MDDGGGRVRLADEFVDRDGDRAEQRSDGAAVGVAGVLRRRAGVAAGGRFDHAGVEGADLFEDVGGGLDEDGAVADQEVAALRAGVEGAAGDGHDVAAHLGGEAGGDERTGLRRGLHDDGAGGEAGDDAVARGEVAGARLGAGGLFGQEEPAGRNRLLQVGIFGREGDVDAAADDAHGAGVDAAGMGGGVDAAGEAGDDRDALMSQRKRQLAREAAGGGGRIARADDRDAGAARERQVAADDERGRRGVDLGEQARIIGVAEEEVARAEPADLRDLALDLRQRGRGGGGTPAAAGKGGKRVERGLCGAEAGDQLRIGDRADAGGADEAKAGRDLVSHARGGRCAAPYRRAGARY